MAGVSLWRDIRRHLLNLGVRLAVFEELLVEPGYEVHAAGLPGEA
jgi:hypothetical protein